MGIENSKRWHWIVVALVVGPALAFMNGQAEPGAGLRSMSGAEFEREVALKEVPGDNPNLKNVVVHPAQIGAYDKPVFVVTMDRAVFDKKEKGWRYQPYALQAEVPYVSSDGAGRRGGPAAASSASSPDRTILDALKDLSAKTPTIKYKYAWWEEPKWSYGLWSAGSLAAIGGIWPTVLALMLGAGLGPKPKEPEYDLDRFKSSEGETESAAANPAPKTMSDDDRQRLHTQLEKLEQNIGSAAVMTDVPAPSQAQGAAGAAGGPAPIRQLNGGPVEMQAPLDKEDEDKEYKGEFYPVARVAQPKAEEPAGKSH